MTLRRHSTKKAARVAVCFLAAVCMLWASPVRAIGFDPEALYPAVFVVYSGDVYGSGFAIGENCIVTNAHVIEDKNDVTVKTFEGDTLRASVVVYNAELDIALLAVEDVTLEFLAVADPDAVGVGDDIYAIGAPNNLEYTLTKGIVSAMGRQVGGNEYIQIDAAIDRGNSGGPLVSDAGEAVGVNTMKAQSEGIGFAVPMSAVCACLKEAGIPLTGSGNVEGRVEGGAVIWSDEAEQNESAPALSEPPERVSVGSALWAWAIAAGVLILLLAIIFMARSRKKRRSDPSERTNFDIDFWE